MKKPELMMDSEMEQHIEQAPDYSKYIDSEMIGAKPSMDNEEASLTDNAEIKKMAMEKIKAQYGLEDKDYSSPAIVAKIMAEKQGIPFDRQAQMQKGIEDAGEMGMQGGMSMGSLGNAANIGKYSKVTQGLIKEIGAANKANNLMQLGAKAGDASKVINNSPKMSPEQLKALAAAFGKKVGF